MAAADRNLVFGLLALQNGLIDQVALVAAFQAWTRDKTRPLAEHLVARGALDDEQPGAGGAVAAVRERRNGGDAGKSLAGVPAGRSPVESLAGLHDPEVDATLAQ